MKKMLIILCFIAFSGFSQDFQGKAYYMSKMNVNMDWMKNLPPDRQASVKASMKTATEKNYILNFNSSSSFFSFLARYFAASSAVAPSRPFFLLSLILLFTFVSSSRRLLNSSSRSFKRRAASPSSQASRPPSDPAT